METIDAIARQLLEHPRRRAFVITLTCLIALLAVWPAVDRFLVLREFKEDLLMKIEEARAEIVGLEDLAEIAARRASELTEWEERIVSEDETHEFRNLIVGLARSNGCRVRRVDVGISTQAKWTNGDDDNATPNSGKAAAKNSPYELRKQTVNVTVAGELTTVLAFLGELDADNCIKDHHTFLIRPTAGEPGEVVVELELILMEPKHVGGAAT